MSDSQPGIPNAPPAGVEPPFIGGGEMGRLVGAKDWSQTPLGPISSWPQSLLTAVNLCLASNFPISLAWGPHHVQIYNDGYRPICGDKHPQLLGQDFTQSWASTFPAMVTAFRSALGGTTAVLEDQPMFLDRMGRSEETFFTFSFSPIRDETGRVAGLFHPATETTSKVLAQRRARALRGVAAAGLSAQSLEATLQTTARVLEEFNLDLPFALSYRLDENTHTARLVFRTGLAPGAAAAPETVDLTQADGVWPLTRVATGKPLRLDDVRERCGALVCAPYPEPVGSAFLLPLTLPGHRRPTFVLVAGASPRLPINDAYTAFYELLAAAVTKVMADTVSGAAERQRADALGDIDRAKAVKPATENELPEVRCNVGMARLGHESAAQPDRHIEECPADLASTEAEARRPLTAADSRNALLGALKDQQEAEAALRMSKEQLQFVTDHAPVMLAHCDWEQRYKFVNRPFAEMFGFQTTDVIGKFPRDILGGKVYVQTQPYREAALKGQSIEYDLVLPTPSGEERAVHVHYVPQRDPSGRVIGFVAAMTDITERKRMEAERQKFMMLIDSSSEFIGMCDLQMKPLYVNPAGVRMVGLPDMAAACRVKVQDYFFPEDRAFITEEFFPRVLREGHGDVEIRLRHFQTGQPIWMFYYLFHVLDAGGKVVGWATVSRDITERKRAEEELRQSQKQFSDAFHASPAGLTITRIADGKFIEINEAFLSMFELSREEVLGHTSLELNIFKPEERAALIRRQLETGGLRNHSLQARARSGQIRHLLFSSNPIELAGQPCHITTLIDVTNSKEAEAALRESEDKFKYVFEAANVGKSITLPTGEIHPNKAFCDLLGYKQEELQRKTWQELTPREEIAPIQAILASLLDGGKDSSRFTKRYIHANGSEVWADVSVALRRDREGKPIHFIATIVDITERKRAEEELLKYRDHLEELIKERTLELREANRHLQELDRLKSMFIASMSHELRTPLNSIIGFTGIILMGMSGEISDVQRKQLGMVKKSANHLLDLINDVIDVSKIETGKTELSIETFDLSDLLLELKESFSITASEKGLNLEWETAGVTDVTSDRRRVKQILVNLIGNALKFTSTGTVAVALSRAKRGANIRVSDTGVGIAPADMQMLFAAFSRIHISGRPVVEGTGLGLHLSRRIAELLGGEITAESQFGRGSTFTLFLPWGPQEEEK